MIDVIGRGENLGLIDVVDLDGLQDLRLDDVTDALEGHDGAGACLLGDACLLGRGNVHDDAALEHLRELAIEFDAVGLAVLFCHGCSLGWHVHCLTEHPIGELGMTKYSVFEIITRSD